MSPNAKLVTLITLFLIFLSPTSQSPDIKSFINCLSLQTPPSTNISHLISTPTSPSFSSLLLSSIRNLRFVNPLTCQPVIIITPSQPSHIQASVLCSRNQSLNLRIRSGGHDYEGLSYRSLTSRSFAILDLINIRSISLDVDQRTAWVGGGATVGEVYYRISLKSRVLGFPAGKYPTVGVGGQFAGGGFGTLLRKFGLACDSIVDAQIVNADGEILDRESMGEDLFWAIRGGGGGSFGVVVSWKINLVPVPATVSVFTIHKTLNQGALLLVNKWQYIAHQLPVDLFIRIILQKNNQGNEVVAKFNSLFLGNCDDLVKLMGESFAELGFEREDCREMSWIESVMYFAGLSNGEPLEVLLDRGKPYKSFNGKSDFVTEPIPEFAWESIWPRFLDEGAGKLILEPFGGKMSEISESETPFAYRAGYLYNVNYYVDWTNRSEEESRKHMDWICRLYNEMGPYVSKNPRASYVNFRDLDLGSDIDEGSLSSRYSNAKIWGEKYFKDNFERLARVKGRVDPSDFFSNEQSIPPLVEEEIVEDNKVYKGKVEGESSRHQNLLSFFLSNMF